MAAYTYPDSEELMDIENEKLEALTLDSPVFSIFPIRQVEDWKLRWTVKGHHGGLQQLRGLDVASQHVERIGEQDYEFEPGVYGEHESMKEEELKRRAAKYYPGGGQGSIDLTDDVMEMQDELLGRRIRLIKYIAWTLLCTGTFAIADKKGTGGYRHTDTFSLGTYNASTWATAATATPLLDMRTAALTGRGKRVNFGRGAKAFANLNTIYNMLANTNANDLGGKNAANLSTITSVSQANEIFVANDLPPITPIEEGYYNLGSDTFNLFVPDGKVIMVSGDVEDSGPVGEYRMTYQVVTDSSGAPSPYTFVDDSTKRPGAPTVPPQIKVEDGHNGGPVAVRPYKVLILDVS